MQIKISREEARALGVDTVDILEAGFYVTASGSRVEIREQIDEAVRGTVSYPPETELADRSAKSG